MFIAITIASIFIIAGLAWLLNRFQEFKICPICTGVFGTWFWMLVVKFLEYEVDLIILAMLMGGSVVGVAYQIKRVKKILFIPIGFVAVYSIIFSRWALFFVFLTILAILAIEPAVSKNGGRKTIVPRSSKAKELEEKMKDCC